jgi:hypothetical protein
MTNRPVIAVTGFVVLASACSYRLVSPPARMVTLESARTLAPKETAVAVKGGGQIAMFEPSAAVGTVMVRRGISDKLEVSGEVSYARLWGYADDERIDVEPSIYAGRAGIKLAGNRHLAMAAGVGGGYAPAAGSFGAIDVGGIASYDNCYVVPFGALTGFLSQPLGAKTVDFGSHGTSRASSGYGLAVSTGVEVPLLHERCRQGHAIPKVQLGASINYLGSFERTDTGSDNRPEKEGGDYASAGLTAGVEIPF